MQSVSVGGGGEGGAVFLMSRVNFPLIFPQKGRRRKASPGPRHFQCVRTYVCMRYIFIPSAVRVARVLALL